MKHVWVKKVKTRKPHVCWGCTDSFPANSTMFYKSKVDSGFSHCYWCADCYLVIQDMEDWELQDGIERGSLNP